ncbi:mCG140524, partial [Mus musculus]
LWVLVFCSPPAVFLADFQRARKVQTCSGPPRVPEPQKQTSAQELQVRRELRGAGPPSPVPAYRPRPAWGLRTPLPPRRARLCQPRGAGGWGQAGRAPRGQEWNWSPCSVSYLSCGKCTRNSVLTTPIPAGEMPRCRAGR